jgi:hypothetical protein
VETIDKLAHAILRAGGDRVIRRFCKVQEAVDWATELKGLLAPVFGERDEAIKNAQYWVQQHGVEAEKRGQCEHELDLARGNLAGDFERVERERDAAIDRVDALANDLARLHRRIAKLETALDTISRTSRHSSILRLNDVPAFAQAALKGTHEA